LWPGKRQDIIADIAVTVPRACLLACLICGTWMT
jgi:hypothetical protein